ncbi:MAG: hypothetical protein WC895_01515 [Candidatus Shapirobacteria bacterium]|jgi:ABC-type transport system involved in multi-copper enzyme maturation permease subunit
MKIFENIATWLAYSSLGIFAICLIIAFVITLFGSVRFGEKYDKFYFRIGIYFCLPLYGLSFLSKGISEKIAKKDSLLSFVMAIVFFLIMFILVSRKKIKK